MTRANIVAQEIVREIVKSVNQLGKGKLEKEIHYSEVMTKYDVSINQAKAILMIVANKLKEMDFEVEYKRGKLRFVVEK